MSSYTAKATGGALAGALIAALMAGAIFWARSMQTEVREGFRAVRTELQTLNYHMSSKLDPLLEFRGAAQTQLHEIERRVGRIEDHNGSAR